MKIDNQAVDGAIFFGVQQVRYKLENMLLHIFVGSEGTAEAAGGK